MTLELWQILIFVSAQFLPTIMWSITNVIKFFLIYAFCHSLTITGFLKIRKIEEYILMHKNAYISGYDIGVKKSPAEGFSLILDEKGIVIIYKGSVGGHNNFQSPSYSLYIINNPFIKKKEKSFYKITTLFNDINHSSYKITTLFNDINNLLTGIDSNEIEIMYLEKNNGQTLIDDCHEVNEFKSYPWQEKLSSVITAILKNKNHISILITGPPGIGKSSFIRFLTIEMKKLEIPLESVIKLGGDLTKDYSFDDIAGWGRDNRFLLFNLNEFNHTIIYAKKDKSKYTTPQNCIASSVPSLLDFMDRVNRTKNTIMILTENEIPGYQFNKFYSDEKDSKDSKDSKDFNEKDQKDFENTGNAKFIRKGRVDIIVNIDNNGKLNFIRK